MYTYIYLRIKLFCIIFSKTSVLRTRKYLKLFFSVFMICVIPSDCSLMTYSYRGFNFLVIRYSISYRHQSLRIEVFTFHVIQQLLTKYRVYTIRIKTKIEISKKKKKHENNLHCFVIFFVFINVHRVFEPLILFLHLQ